MLPPEIRRELDCWDAENPTASHGQRLLQEQKLRLDRPQQWHTTALGRFPHVLVQGAVLHGDFTEIAVVTDGARFAQCDWRRVESPYQWMTELRDWELKHRSPPRRHSDVALVWLRLNR